MLQSGWQTRVEDGCLQGSAPRGWVWKSFTDRGRCVASEDIGINSIAVSRDQFGL